MKYEVYKNYCQFFITTSKIDKYRFIDVKNQVEGFTKVHPIMFCQSHTSLFARWWQRHFCHILIGIMGTYLDLLLPA